MYPGSLEAGHVLLAPSNVKSQPIKFLRAIRRIPHTVSVWVMRVESRHALAMLSDHVLRDIGLTRNDVDRELLKPFWRD